MVLHLLDAFPEADLHTSLFLPEGTFDGIAPERVKTHFLQKFVPLRTYHRLAFPILAPSWSNYRVDADVVLCSSSGWAHGVKTDGRKIVYCHAPARWLYQPDLYLKRTQQRVALAALSTLKGPLKAWDGRAARSAHRYIANSGLIRDAIKSTYGIDAEVLPPPVSLNPKAERQPIDGIEPGFHLCVTRLMPYKNVDVVIEAYQRLGFPLVIVGEGPERARLGDSTPINVTFAGRVTDAELRWLYANCELHVSASYEDFGLVTVEAASFGKPTVGPRYGGFLDTVIEGDTGLLFDTIDSDELATAVKEAVACSWDPMLITRHADRFSVEAFRSRLHEIVAEEAALASGTQQRSGYEPRALV